MASDPTQPPPTADVLAEIRAVVAQAKGGDATAVPRLRELLDAHPALWRHYGDLAQHAEQAWVALAAGSNEYLKESLTRQTAAMRTELAGPAPAPAETLLVQRVVACWLQVQYFDTIEAQAIDAGEAPRRAAYRGKRQAQAHRNYMSANRWRYRRTAEGAVIYSTGPDGRDDGGNIESRLPTDRPTDIGFTLWDVSRRPQPPWENRP